MREDPGDWHDSPDHHLNFGIGTTFNRALDTTGVGQNVFTGTTDLVYQYRGWGVTAVGHYAKNSTTPLQAFGLLGQVGYFFIPEKLELALRGMSVMVTEGIQDGMEFGGTLSYLIKGHSLKIQTDYGVLIHSPLVFQGTHEATNFVATGMAPGFNSDQIDHRIRLQFQFLL